MKIPGSLSLHLGGGRLLKNNDFDIILLLLILVSSSFSLSLLPPVNSRIGRHSISGKCTLTSRISIGHHHTLRYNSKYDDYDRDYDDVHQNNVIKRRRRSRSSRQTELYVLNRKEQEQQEKQEQQLDRVVDSTIDATKADTATIQEEDDDEEEEAEEENQSTITSAVATLSQKLFLGIEPTPEILAIMSIYFVEGALGLARLAQTFYLKDTLHLGPAELSALTGLFTLPWTIKPLYGFLSDGLPLFGYRRRSYLILCGLVGSFSYIALGMNFFGLFDDGAVASAGDTSTMIQATIASFVISSGCIAFSDVVADGIVVQRTRDSDDPKVAGGLQSLCWGSAAIGGLISAYSSGSLLEVMGPTDVFKITAVLPLLVATIAFFISEEPMQKKVLPSSSSSSSSSSLASDSTSSNIGFGVEMQPESSTIMSTLPISASFSKKSSSQDEGKEIAVVATLNDSASLSSSSSSSMVMGENQVSEQVQSLWKAIKEPAVWKPALFLFLWQSTPTSEGAFLYFMTNDLGFGPEFLGRVRVVTAVASLLGVWGYQKFLRTVPIKKILFWTSIASAPLGLVNLLLISHANRSLGIPDGAFVFGDDVVLAILGEFAFLPTLVLAARICPPGVEAVLFATLMSIFNGASTVGTEVGALLTKMLGVTESNFENLGLLTIICNLTSLYPLFFIGLLDGVGTKSEAEMEDEDDVVNI